MLSVYSLMLSLPNLTFNVIILNLVTEQTKNVAFLRAIFDDSQKETPKSGCSNSRVIREGEVYIPSHFGEIEAMEYVGERKESRKKQSSSRR